MHLPKLKGHLGGQKRPNFFPEHASASPRPRIAGGKKTAAGPAPLPGRATGPAFGPALGPPAFSSSKSLTAQQIRSALGLTPSPRWYEVKEEIKRFRTMPSSRTGGFAARNNPAQNASIPVKRPEQCRTFGAAIPPVDLSFRSSTKNPLDEFCREARSVLQAIFFAPERRQTRSDENRGARTR